MSRTLIAAALFAAVSTPAVAQGLYADAGYTFVTIDVEEAGQSADIDLGAISGRVGYTFNEWFGVEGEAAIGVADESANLGGISADLQLNYLVGAYARAQAALNEDFTVYGRLGVVQAELEASLSGPGFNISESDSDNGLAYGAGVEYMFTDQLGVRGDYTRYDFEDGEADAFTIAAAFKF